MPGKTQKVAPNQKSMNSRIAGIAVLTWLCLVTPGFAMPAWVEVSEKDLRLPTLYSRMYGAYDASSVVVRGNQRTVMTRTVFKSLADSPTTIPSEGESVFEEMQFDCAAGTSVLLSRGTALNKMFPVKKKIVSPIDPEYKEGEIFNRLCGVR